MNYRAGMRINRQMAVFVAGKKDARGRVSG